jgi:hypothetical protein
VVHWRTQSCALPSLLAVNRRLLLRLLLVLLLLVLAPLQQPTLWHSLLDG